MTYAEWKKNELAGEGGFTFAEEELTLSAYNAGLEHAEHNVCDECDPENSGKYKLALELALILLSRYEPGDSRAVSDDFVAMAAIHADANTSDDCVALVHQSIIRECAKSRDNDKAHQREATVCRDGLAPSSLS